MATYRIPTDQEGNPIDGVVIREEDGAEIPFAPGNRDYEEYLRSLG